MPVPARGTVCLQVVAGLAAVVVLAGAAPNAAVELARQNVTMQEPVTARDVLEKAIRAKGGADALRAVKTVVMTGTMMVAAGKPVTAQMTNYIEYPGRFRQDAKLPSGEVTQVYADGHTWMKDATGVRDVPLPGRENLAATVSRDVIVLLLAASDGRLRAQEGPTHDKDDRAVFVLRLAGRGLAPVDLLVDRATGVITGKRYIVEQRGPAGRVPTEEHYSDYRTVSGVRVAFRTIVRRGAAVILEQTLSELRINAPIDPALFARPR